MLSTPAALALAGLLAAVTAFDCPSYVSNYGFRPVCCLNINGQVGVGCELSISHGCLKRRKLTLKPGIPAHQMGAENPTWECNAAVYNNEGCCQSIVRLSIY